MLRTSAILLLVVFTTLTVSAANAATKAKPKPQPAKQLSTDKAQFGVTHKLGKEYPINITLVSAEYTVGTSHWRQYLLPEQGRETPGLHLVYHNLNTDDYRAMGHSWLHGGRPQRPEPRRPEGSWGRRPMRPLFRRI